MTTQRDDSCPVCGAPLGAGHQYVLLPADDVPVSGSRTEILVTPGRALRVTARICPAGHVSFVAAPSLAS